MLKEYPKFKRNAIWKFYEQLDKQEKKLLEDYIIFRKARGVSADRDLLDIKRYMIQLRYILEKDMRKISLNEVRHITAIINTSWLKNEVKNGLKIDFKNFLKYLFPDWSMKFSDLEDIKQNSRQNEEKINSQTIFTKEDIEKLMKHENNLLYKTFLIVQYEAGLRTGECRTLKWDSIKFNVDEDISEIGIYATKTSKARTIFVKEATFYLKKLKEELENTGKKSIYVFPSKSKKNMPIDKNSISMWFRNLTKKALGREGWNYLLRHSRATELYRLADENKISKETAIKFMGHSADMSKTYTHLDKQAVKEMLKNQVYKLEEIPEEKKNELEEKIKILEIKIEAIQEYIISGSIGKNASLEQVEELKDIFKRKALNVA